MIEANLLVSAPQHGCFSCMTRVGEELGGVWAHKAMVISLWHGIVNENILTTNLRMCLMAPRKISSSVPNPFSQISMCASLDILEQLLYAIVIFAFGYSTTILNHIIIYNWYITTMVKYTNYHYFYNCLFYKSSESFDSILTL